MELFHSREILGRVYYIQDPWNFGAILVLGQKEALLFDTMCGIGDLPAYVRSLTGLPVTVVLSHGHFDHVGGANRFQRVYMSPLEAETLEICYETDHCIKLIRDGWQNYRQMNGIDDSGISHGFEDPQPPVTLTLQEGEVFDLGGRQLEVIALPGHTHGSVGLFCREERFILTGDAATPVMCLFFETSSVQDYLSTLDRLEQLDFDWFITSHHDHLFPKQQLKLYREAALFSQADRGMKFQHDLLPRYRGRFHIYRGENSDDYDFVGIIRKTDDTK